MFKAHMFQEVSNIIVTLCFHLLTLFNDYSVGQCRYCYLKSANK